MLYMPLQYSIITSSGSAQIPCPFLQGRYLSYLYAVKSYHPAAIEDYLPIAAPGVYRELRAVREQLVHHAVHIKEAFHVHSYRVLHTAVLQCGLADASRQVVVAPIGKGVLYAALTYIEYLHQLGHSGLVYRYVSACFHYFITCIDIFVNFMAEFRSECHHLSDDVHVAGYHNS